MDDCERFLVVLVLIGVAAGCGGDLDVEQDGPARSPDAGTTDVEDAGSEPDPDTGPPTTGPDASDDGEVIDPGPIPNDGWIGGACSSATECTYDDAVCLQGDAYDDGLCSLGCDRICPDRDGNNSVTFCIEEDGEGRCVPRCDFELFPEGGCREGYTCRIVSRFGEPGTQQPACVPEGAPNPDATTACLRELDDQGVIWAPWNYTTQYASGAACTVDDPIVVASPINGVTYRYYNQDTAGTMAMACELALALHRLGDLLAEHDVTDVLHIGTFNCRTIGGTSRLSQHGHGAAIDIWGFEDSGGDEYILERHWEHDTETPRDRKAKLLYDVAQGMHDQRIFNIVLTPNYNAAHDNHFHVDLTPGSDFIGYSTPPEYYLGDDLDRWEEHCPDL